MRPLSTASVSLTGWSPPERPPRTLFDFAARFPDEESCLRYLAQVRWPRGFHCSGCGGGSCWWLYTDGRPSYRGLDKLGYEHWPTAIAQTNSPAHVVMPRVHRVASLLKRWLRGTHQGGLQVEQLDYYLDEFVFRFNRRTSRSRGSLFLRLLEQGCQVAPVTGDRIRGGHP